MLGAGFGQHPGLAVPVKHGGKGQVAAGGQHHLRCAEAAVVRQRDDRNVPPPGGQVKGLAEDIARAVPHVEQRVGVPGLAVEGQRREGPLAQGGQRLVGGDAPHRNGVDLLLAGKFFEKPFGRHVQSAIELVHGNTLNWELGMRN